MANRRFIDFPIATTVGDNDIVLIWQDGANKQTTKATILSGLPENLEDLNDVVISGLTNGQILRYDSVTGKWENTDQGNLDLNDLNDVSIVSPSNGQVLVYNSSTNKWENSSAGFVPYTGAVTTVNLGAQTIQAGQFVKAGGTSSQFLKADGSIDSTAYGTGSVTSVALTMPSAFNVANSPITTAGTLAVTGAGTVGQYIRGDGSLADFPQASGGGSSVSYYLNGSVNQGTIGGVDYRELSKVPILGAGTQFSINANGYIAQFLTDAGDPNLLEIPGGNWNFETYFSASSGGGTPTFYVELYKYDGTTFTLIASSSTAPEFIAFGTNLTPYYSTLAVPTTTLALTDRLAVRYYVTHSGRTITMHTENNTLCQIVTTFTTGLTSLNGLTAQVQNLAVGTSGSDFNIVSATATHTFNLPTASATNRGALSSADWTIFNNKQNALGYVPVPETRTLTINGVTQDLSANRTFNVGTVTSVGLSSATSGVTIGSTPVTSSGTITLAIATASGSQNGLLSSTDWTTFNNKQNALTNPVTGTGASGQVAYFNGTTTITSESNLFWDATNDRLGIGTSSPTERLTLHRDGATGVYAHWRNNSNANNAYIGITGSGLMQIQNNGNIDFYTGASYNNQMTLAGTGNLIIGNPGSDNGSRLQVSGTATFSSSVTAGDLISTSYGTARIQIISTANNTNAALRFTAKDSGGTSKNSGLYYVAGTNTSNTFLSLSADDNNYQFNVLANGNLLVGTTTDNGARLQVSGTATFSSSVTAAGLYFTSNDTPQTVQGTITRHSVVGLVSRGVTSAVFDWSVYSAGGTALISNPTGTNNINFNSGNVGIGTATFAYSPRLAVASVGQNSIAIQTTDVVQGSTGTVLYIGTGASTGNSTYGIIRALGNGGTAATNLVLQESGNVLIGTTTDNGARLQVSGGATFSGASSRIRLTDTNITNPSFNTLLIEASAQNKFSLGVNSTSSQNYAITIDGITQNVGIGTSSPNSFNAAADNLVVGTTSGNNGITIAAATNGFSSIYFADGTTGNEAFRGYFEYGHSADYLAFGTAASERMRITSSGNLLVGTTTDNGARLQVSGDASINGLTVGRGSGNINSNTIVGNGAGNSNTSGSSNSFFGRDSGFFNTSGNRNCSFGQNAGAFQTIGNNNLFFGFDSGRNIANGSNLTESYDSIFIGLGTRADGNGQVNQIVIGHNAVGNGSNTVVLGNSSISRTLLNGNVLIGTTTDNGQRLQVNGNMLVSGSVRFTASGTDANRWSVYWNGANGDLIVVNNISDIRAKKDFDYNIKGLETITKLKPLKFTWKDGTSHSTSVSGRLRQYGFIAQETMQADDYLAWHNERQDTWGIEQYESFCAVIVKAIQEQQEIINDLKQKIQ